MWIPRETSHKKCEFLGKLQTQQGKNVETTEGYGFLLLGWILFSLFFFPPFFFWGGGGVSESCIYSACLCLSVGGEEVVTFWLPKIVSVCRHSEDAGAVCTECEGEIPWHLRLCQDLHDPRNGQQTWPLPDHWCQLHSGHQRLWERMLLNFSSLRCKRECSFSDRNCLVIQLVTSFAIVKAVTDTCGTPAIVKAVRQVTHLR